MVRDAYWQIGRNRRKKRRRLGVRREVALVALVALVVIIATVVQPAVYKLAGRVMEDAGFGANGARGAGVLLGLGAAVAVWTLFRPGPPRASRCWLLAAIPAMTWIFLAAIFRPPTTDLSSARDEIQRIVEDKPRGSLVYEASKAEVLVLAIAGFPFLLRLLRDNRRDKIDKR